MTEQLNRLCILLLLLAASGCDEPKDPVFHDQFFAFGTLIDLTLYGVEPAAARQASEEPALPVLAVDTTRAPVSMARHRVTALARSLSEALGLWLSSLRYSLVRPACWPSRCTWYRGVLPIRKGKGDCNLSTGNSAW